MPQRFQLSCPIGTLIRSWWFAFDYIWCHPPKQQWFGTLVYRQCYSWRMTPMEHMLKYPMVTQAQKPCCRRCPGRCRISDTHWALEPFSTWMSARPVVSLVNFLELVGAGRMLFRDCGGRFRIAKISADLIGMNFGCRSFERQRDPAIRACILLNSRAVLWSEIVYESTSNEDSQWILRYQ